MIDTAFFDKVEKSRVDHVELPRFDSGNVYFVNKANEQSHTRSLTKLIDLLRILILGKAHGEATEGQNGLGLFVCEV